MSSTEMIDNFIASACTILNLNNSSLYDGNEGTGIQGKLDSILHALTAISIENKNQAADLVTLEEIIKILNIDRHRKILIKKESNIGNAKHSETLIIKEHPIPITTGFEILAIPIIKQEPDITIVSAPKEVSKDDKAFHTVLSPHPTISSSCEEVPSSCTGNEYIPVANPNNQTDKKIVGADNKVFNDESSGNVESIGNVLFTHNSSASSNTTSNGNTISSCEQPRVSADTTINKHIKDEEIGNQCGRVRKKPRISSANATPAVILPPALQRRDRVPPAASARRLVDLDGEGTEKGNTAENVPEKTGVTAHTAPSGVREEALEIRGVPRDESFGSVKHFFGHFGHIQNVHFKRGDSHCIVQMCNRDCHESLLRALSTGVVTMRPGYPALHGKMIDYSPQLAAGNSNCRANDNGYGRPKMTSFNPRVRRDHQREEPGRNSNITSKDKNGKSDSYKDTPQRSTTEQRDFTALILSDFVVSSMYSPEGRSR